MKLDTAETEKRSPRKPYWTRSAETSEDQPAKLEAKPQPPETRKRQPSGGDPLRRESVNNLIKAFEPAERQAAAWLAKAAGDQAEEELTHALSHFSRSHEMLERARTLLPPGASKDDLQIQKSNSTGD